LSIVFDSTVLDKKIIFGLKYSVFLEDVNNHQLRSCFMSRIRSRPLAVNAVERRATERVRILGKIREVLQKIADQERDLPFDFSADDELSQLASGQRIADDALCSVIEAFLQRPAVLARLKLFRSLEYYQRRLRVLDSLDRLEVEVDKWNAGR
jgi:hypothetical protein